MELGVRITHGRIFPRLLSSCTSDNPQSLAEGERESLKGRGGGLPSAGQGNTRGCIGELVCKIMFAEAE